VLLHLDAARAMSAQLVEAFAEQGTTIEGRAEDEAEASARDLLSAPIPTE